MRKTLTALGAVVLTVLICVAIVLVGWGNTWGDRVWGVDIHRGIGENHLGKILMRIRSELGDTIDKFCEAPRYSPR